ncbi:MAG: S41 family peptidase [Aureispira sp.]
MKSLFLSLLLYSFCYVAQGQQISLMAVEDATKDIDHLLAKFEAIHYNPYFLITKEQLTQTKDSLTADWGKDSITLKEFMVVGMKLSALLSGGHSYMDWKAPNIIAAIKAHQYLPFTGELRNNYQTFIVTRSKDTTIPAGTILESINGIPMVELYQECMSFIGGIKAFKNASCEEMFPLYLFFIKELKAPYHIVATNKDKAFSIDGVEIEAFLTFINEVPYQVPYTFEIINGKVGLLTYNRCENYKKFKRFLRKTFRKIQAQKINQLIIDIRENGGGNSSLNDLLLSYLTTRPYQQSSGRYWKVSQEAKALYSANEIYQELFGAAFMKEYTEAANGTVIPSLGEELTHPVAPKHFFSGKHCFLIGPSTFSSANFLADAVKTYKISTLIGTATGEYTNDFGEQIYFTLPNSGCKVYVSSTYDIGANGDDSTLTPVEPDLVVPSNVLPAAIEWLEQQK